MASSGSYSLIRTSIPGCFVVSSPRTGISERLIAVAKPATRTTPCGSSPGSRSRRAASTAARIVTACSASRCPAGVSRTRRPTGSTSGWPTSAASAASCWETLEVVMPSSSATSRIDPSRDSSSRSAEAARMHAMSVHDLWMIRPAKSRGRERLARVFTVHMTVLQSPPSATVAARARGPAPASRWRRCSACSSDWPPPSASSTSSAPRVPRGSGSRGPGVLLLVDRPAAALAVLRPGRCVPASRWAWSRPA